MNDKLEDQLKDLRQTPFPDGLQGQIMSAVGREARRQRMALYILYPSLISMALFSFLSIRLFFSDLAGSPLAQLLKLAWTDTRSVLSYFSDWSLAVMESTPVDSLALALGAVFISMLIISRITSVPRVAFRQIKKAV